MCCFLSCSCIIRVLVCHSSRISPQSQSASKTRSEPKEHANISERTYERTNERAKEQRTKGRTKERWNARKDGRTSEWRTPRTSTTHQRHGRTDRRTEKEKEREERQWVLLQPPPSSPTASMTRRSLLSRARSGRDGTTSGFSLSNAWRWESRHNKKNRGRDACLLGHHSDVDRRDDEDADGWHYVEREELRVRVRERHANGPLVSDIYDVILLKNTAWAKIFQFIPSWVDFN